MTFEKSRKRAEIKAKNRATILEAARSCFLQLGYDTTTVRDIIRSTHLAPGTFYNYFPDKESIFRALIDDYINQIEQRRKQLLQNNNHLEDYIHNTFLAYFLTIEDLPSLFQLALRSNHIILHLYQKTLLGCSSEILRNQLSGLLASTTNRNIDLHYMASAIIGTAYQIGIEFTQRSNKDASFAAKFCSSLVLGGLGVIPKQRNVEEDIA